MGTDQSAGDEVYRISGAGRSLSDDVNSRTRRYLISMAARTACFLGCVLSFVVLKNAILGWILFVGALLLPYVAVVVANGQRQRTAPVPTTTLLDPRQSLPPGSDPPHSP
jgi:hypothetical protein